MQCHTLKTSNTATSNQFLNMNLMHLHSLPPYGSFPALPRERSALPCSSSVSQIIFLISVSVNPNNSCEVPHTLSLLQSLGGHYSNLIYSELSWDSKVWSGNGNSDEGVSGILAASVSGLIFLYFPTAIGKH